MTVQERLYTAADLAHLPDDGTRFELVRGELIEMPPPKRIHGRLVARLILLIGAFISERRLGEILAESGFMLAESPDTVRAPDVAFISNARLKPATNDYDRVAPDLAVEVVSPGNTVGMMHDKIAQYFAAGVRQVWLVFPESRAVHVYRSAKQVTILDGSDMLDGGDVLPGFSVPVSAVFADLTDVAEVSE